MRVALDSNILVYAHGVDGAAMRRKALDVLDALPDDDVVLPAQALGEIFNVLVRKAQWGREKARAAVLEWRDSYPIVDTSGTVLARAIDLSAEHRLSIWDAVILSASAESGCRLLLSEGLQAGFTWQGVTVVNPFIPQSDPLFAALLAERDRR